jgi:glucose-like phosphotransferase system IIB component
LYKKGIITKEEINYHPNKNQITKAIGAYPSIKVKSRVIRNDYSYILLCSDGLYNKVNEDDIKEVFYKKVDIKIKVNELICKANNNGGEDNIEDVDACMTRLRVTVKDTNLVSSEKDWKAEGALGLIVKDKGVQAIYGPKADVLKSNILDMLGA